MIALLVWSLWERRVRMNLKNSGEAPLKDTTGKKKTAPTAAVGCHIMNSVQVARMWEGDIATPWTLLGPLNPEQARLVRFSAPVPQLHLPPGPPGKELAARPRENQLRLAGGC